MVGVHEEIDIESLKVENKELKYMVYELED